MRIVFVILIVLLQSCSDTPKKYGNLEVLVDNCKYDGADFAILWEFNLYQDDSLNQKVTAEPFKSTIIDSLLYGNYSIEFVSNYKMNEIVKFQLDSSFKQVVLCLDDIDHDKVEWIPVIDRLKINEKYELFMSSRGCFHQWADSLTITLNSDSNYSMEHHEQMKTLSAAEVKLIQDFEKELSLIYPRGCTTVDEYVLTYDKEEIEFLDGSCYWMGGMRLLRDLSLIRETP